MIGKGMEFLQNKGHTLRVLSVPCNGRVMVEDVMFP